MTILSIDDLISPLTSDQVRAQFITELETLGVPAKSWRKGGALSTMLTVTSLAYASFTQVQSFFVRSGFLDLASGGWLTLLAHYVYGVDRIGATFANGGLTLVNGGGGVFTFGIGEVIARDPVIDKTYTNTEAFSLNPSQTKTIHFQATEAGSASTAAPADVSELVTVMLGVTVSNASALVGTDDEPDPTLQGRCRDKLASLSPNGPRGAYSYAVRSATRSDGSPVDINRMQISPSSSQGVVTVWCASPSGAPSAGDLDYVRTSIENIARPDSVTVVVNAATPVALSASLTVWALSAPGVSVDTLTTLVTNAIIALAKSYPIGGIAKPPSAQGYLYASTIEGAAKSAHAAIFAVDVFQGDLALNQGDVATLSTAVTVRIVEAPIQ
jgi:hypothetical protein